MAKLRYSILALGSMALGVVLTGIEVLGSVTFLLDQAQPSYLVLGGAVVTACAAILLPLAERCVRDKRYVLAAFLIAALVPALLLIFCAAVERTGGAKDQATRDRQSVAAVISSREIAVTKAEAEVADKDLVVTNECTKAPKGVDPDGPRCRAAKKLVAESRERLDAARDKLEKSGVAPKSDPMAKRLAAVIPGLTEEAVLLYQPLTLPLTISMLGILLIAAGARPPKPRKVVKERRGKRKRRPVRKAQPSVGRNNVVPLRKRA